MPPIAFLNVGSQFLPFTSHKATTRGSYVPILHNIPHPPPPTVGPSGHSSYGPIGSVSQPPRSSWVPP